MDRAARACAIYTGAVASACLVVSLAWWADPSFGYRAGSAVLVIAFLSGLLGFFVMFGMVYERLDGKSGRRSDLVAFLWKSAFLWKAIPRLLWVWLALVLATAIVSFGVAWGRQGQWEAAAPYSDLPHGCHWPLTANHDTEHLCVSHTRWLEVNLETAHIFVGFGVIFLIIDCAVFTTLSRYPRRPRPTAVPRTVRRPTQSRLPFPPR